MTKALFLILCLSLLGACGLATTRPKLEMSMAQTAFLAAKRANAETLSPSLYRKAEYYYLKAKSAYKRKYFNKAQQYATLSQKFAEQAEYQAVRKKALEGL
jgi:hypothetical protein